LGSRSVAIGQGVLANQNFTSATDSYNTAVGHLAGAEVTTGVSNTLIGALAGDALTEGDLNTVVGKTALGTDTKGSRAVAIGRYALGTQNFTTATANYNVAMGYSAGGAVTTGTLNTFVGGLAGDGTDDGGNNAALGYAALSANCGNENTAFGAYAGTAITGDSNTIVGYTAGFELAAGDNNLFLGKDSGRTGSPGGQIVNGDNEIVLGDDNIGEAHIQVDWTVASDQRDKTDFTALDLGLNFVNALEPLTYKWDKRSKYGDKTADDYDLNDQTPDGTHKEDWLDIGFKAQAVLALEEAAGYKIADKKNLTVSLTGDEKQYGLQYNKFVPILVKALQEADDKIDALTTRIEALES
jgi:hypothetical protein